MEEMERTVRTERQIADKAKEKNERIVCENMQDGVTSLTELDGAVFSGNFDSEGLEAAPFCAAALLREIVSASLLKPADDSVTLGAQRPLRLTASC